MAFNEFKPNPPVFMSLVSGHSAPRVQAFAGLGPGGCGGKPDPRQRERSG